MSDDESIQPFSGIDTSRRSFLQKSAIASGAIAFGGASVGTVAGDQHLENGEDGDSVLMLFPDAVENANAQVVSGEIDWLPWEDEGETGGIGEDGTEDDGVGGDGNETDGENGDDGIGGGENGEDGTGTGENQEYRAHLAQFEFSGSHVAPVFVPQDADISLDDDISLGEVQELVHGPDEPLDGADVGTGGDDGDGGATGGDQNGGNESNGGTDGSTGLGMEDGQPILARVALEQDATGDGMGGEGEDDGPGADGEDEDGPGAGGNESDEDGGGIGSDDNESDDGEDDDDGILSLG